MQHYSYRIVVCTLCLIAIISLSGGIYLSIIEKPIPESLIALGGNAIGALAGLLAPSPIRNNSD
ncbi:hypothetical protein [Planktothrix agardhii]|jgi:hypothetical protein|uniref:Uncharacterized protein n=2 Tax=Planktothrix agardhii TaxID=1160 RepID=A0A4P5ZZL2_PLAAG|nr:hypothetical protein [Planktothrix agardhii]CAD5986108.1 hypothetical protein PCC7821_05070 [Planktothrix rubescens NIVA-CYA 18]MCB8762089.1 hypothetical protein [Planktothrix agardhii 1813]MCB8789010.1 hypothetical protein [Planktothrix agardhii 1025]MCF3578271.1 hypothetical protein [Planktothrix agardhii 1812]MCF3614142.1 hypothetical protein [Planktothrix agardhii 1027]